MRFTRSVIAALAFASGCTYSLDHAQPTVTPLPQAECQQSYLDYQDFGEPFVENWCKGCHSAALPANMRQNAPTTVNFDTQAEVKSWAPQVLVLAGAASPTMPPAGGPSDDERAMLAEWIGCGAR